MPYLEAILALFAIVDPIGNIPLFLQVTEHVPKSQRQKAFNISVAVATLILLIFSCAGDLILKYVFHIEMADLQIAGGILLLVIAIESLVFGSQRRRPSSMRGTFSAVDAGCVPLACPLLAGPGAMVTSLATWKNPAAGPAPALVAIIVVLGLFWVMMKFVVPIQRSIGKLISTVMSKIMLVFIAAIGANMVITGVQFYFCQPK